MQIKVDHWSLVDPRDWLWPNFTPDEIACQGTGKLFVLYDSMDSLQLARDLVGKPFKINSGYRSPEHNSAVGGARDSYHVEGKAFDISLYNQVRDILVENLIKAGFKGIGHYNTFIHADKRPGPLVIFDRRR